MDTAIACVRPSDSVNVAILDIEATVRDLDDIRTCRLDNIRRALEITALCMFLYVYDLRHCMCIYGLFTKRPKTPISYLTRFNKIAT